jgi:hypothetical protein
MGAARAASASDSLSHGAGFRGAPECRPRRLRRRTAPVCCPSACGERYQALRREGLGVEDALAAAIWRKPTCMPGLEGHVEPEP